MGQTDSADLGLIRDSIRRLLGSWNKHGSPFTSTQQIALWQQLCESGWSELGGNTDDVLLLVLAMRELGHAGLTVPLIGAVATRYLIDDPDTIAAVKDGSVRIALALGVFDGDPLSGDAQFANNRLTGTLACIEDAATATHLLVLTSADRICVVNLSEAGIEVAPTPGFAAPPLAQVCLTDAVASSAPLNTDRARQLADLVRLLLIARSYGAAQRSFAMALEYACLRQQFGQTIGKFQAIQHKLADCRVRLDLVEVLLEDAERAFTGSAETERAIANLVSVAAPALRRNAVEVQHVFGAVAYAQEHEVARHFSRIHADTTRLGGARRAHKWLARRLQDAQDRDGVFANVCEPESTRDLRQQVRKWLEQHWSLQDQNDPSRNRDVDFPFIHALAQQGWLAANWPTQYGGPGFDAFEQFAFLEEMRLGNAPMTLISPSYWVVASSIIEAGSTEIKAKLLPEMAQGNISFALGYSEPQAGSDLAALATRAVRDGNNYIINGQKIWTSNTEYASHIFLATRTSGDPINNKHEGISTIVVPIDAPGISIQRTNTLHGKTYAVIFLDNVEVPASMLVGEEGDGWKVLSAALGAERVIMGGQVASLRGYFVALVAALQQRSALANDQLLWERLGELAAELEAARALSLRSVKLISRGEAATVEGAIAKLYGGELAERIGETVLDLCGVEAGLSKQAAGALLDGASYDQLRMSIMLSIGGGTAEIQRNVIARRGLKLPG